MNDEFVMILILGKKIRFSKRAQAWAQARKDGKDKSEICHSLTV